MFEIERVQCLRVATIHKLNTLHTQKLDGNFAHFYGEFQIFPWDLNGFSQCNGKNLLTISDLVNASVYAQR